MHERIGMKKVRNIFYFLLICSLNQVQYGLTTEGYKWVISDLDSLKEASSTNDPFAQAVLALAYVHGDKGLNISLENAQKLARISADSGNWLGLFTLGYIHRFEPFGPNPEIVRNYYLKSFQDPDGQMVKLAARKDPIASYVLGEIFTSDEVRPDVVPDLQLAARHYEIASLAGYHPASVQFALFKLHTIVEAGMGIEKDSNYGVKLLRDAAQQKLPSAHHYLGRSYFKGVGVESDLEMALVHFQAAADRGYGLSQLAVADFYAYGVTGPPKVDLALRYARLALSYDEKSALEKINEFQQIQNGTNNDSKILVQNEVPSPSVPLKVEPKPVAPISELPNIEDSFEVTRLPSPYSSKDMSETPQIPEPSVYSEEAPKDSPSLPRNQIENENQKDLGAIRSEMSSISSTDNKSPEQMCEDAKKLYWGRGVQVDYLAAEELFIRSANGGTAESARYLGLMYLRGKGVEKNLRTSVIWFEKAAKGGDSLAQKNVVTLKAMLGN
jgi:TPR repeat protein